MRYTLLVHRTDAWYVLRKFESERDLLQYCLYYAEEIRDRISMNGNDLVACHKYILAPDGQRTIVERQYYLRDLLIMDEESRIIDPRPLIREAEGNSMPWISDSWQARQYARRMKHYRYSRKPGKSSWNYRKMKHYRRDLKDKYWERYENEDYHIRPKHHTKNAWIIEPCRRCSASWKDQSKRKHQYRQREPLPWTFAEEQER